MASAMAESSRLPLRQYPSPRGRESSSSPTRNRTARACENCRARRTKCEPPYPCRACRTAGLENNCQVRERARPNRQIRQTSSTGTIRHTARSERVAAISRLEKEVERIYAERTGLKLDLSSPEGHTHPLLDLSSPLPPLPQITTDDGTTIEVFIAYCLPMCSVLTPSRVRDLFNRYSAHPSSLSADQTALVYMFLACGHVRVHYFGHFGRSARRVPESQRQDVAWYRHAVATLTKWGSATFTSLHALCVMWLYTTTVSTLQTSRFVTSWMITQARELGLHRKQSAETLALAPTDRADYIWFLLLYAHSYSVSLTGQPPMLRADEFETIISNSQPPPEYEDREIVYPRHAVQELTLLTTRLLLDLHAQDTSAMTLDWLFAAEEQWDMWLQAWSKAPRPSGGNRIDPFAGILWNWGRMLIRAATLEDERLSMSSLAILARSSTQILARYHEWYSTSVYNLVWQHLRHIITCAHVVLICYWRQEMLKKETETTLSSALWILGLAEPRWTTYVQTARQNIGIVANALGLSITLHDSSDVEPVDGSPLNAFFPSGAFPDPFSSGPEDPELEQMFSASSFDFLFTSDMNSTTR